MNMVRFSAAIAWLALSTLSSSGVGVPPRPGDIVINEYASDNTATGNDFVELLVLKDHLDLRGLRVSDNEYVTTTGTMNTGEGVMVFGLNAYLSDIPRGTLIVVWSLAAGVTPDTTVNPASNDYSMALVPGAGLAVGTDGLGGTVNYGWSVSGDAIYLYLPGPNGNSTGTDNIYLDFVSWEADGAVPPPGLFDFYLPSVADNAYFKGNTAAASDSSSQWARYDGPVDGNPPPSNYTPGRPNPTQNLSALRQIGPAPGVTLAQTGGSTAVTEGGATDTYTLALASVPTGDVTLGVTANSQVEIGTNGIVYGPSLSIRRSDTTPVTIHVRALDDSVVEDQHAATIGHAVVQTLDPTRYPTTLPVPSLSVTVTDNDEPPGSIRIHDIQGWSHLSSVQDNIVSNVPGIVTALDETGFYLQDPTPDGDPSTSEGIFVYTASAPTVAVGDELLVTGRVSEYRPGCTPCDPDSSAFSNLTVTEIVATRILEVASDRPLPAATVLGLGGRPIPTSHFSDDASSGSIENAPILFDPADDSLDFFESLEGMRVQVNQALVSGPTSATGEIVVLADGGSTTAHKTTRGGARVAIEGDFHPERIVVDDSLVPDPPSVSVGERFSQPVVGVVSYGFANYRVLNTSPLPPVERPPAAPVPVAEGDNPDSLTLGTMNVRNLDAGDEPSRFASLATTIVSIMGSPAVLHLAEIQDNNGSLDDSEVDASATVGLLIAAVASAGGPAYESRQIDPVDDQNGGEPGGNIRSVLLFDPARVDFVDRPGGSATTPVEVISGADGAAPSLSPGLVAPTHPAFQASRKPLVGEFQFGQHRLVVVAVHLVSKSSDQPLAGRFQPPVRTSETKRVAQASEIAAFVRDLRAAEPDANVVVLGDFNDFPFSASLATLEGEGLVSLWPTVIPDERYSYIHQGNAQILDHVLTSPNLAERSAMQAFHLHVDRPDPATDHDPLVARLTLDRTPPTLRLGCTRLASGTRHDFDVADTLDTAPVVFVKDSASPFVAGPFLHGDSVLVRLNPRQAPYRRDLAGYSALLQIRGMPIVVATDSAGNTVESAGCP